MKSIFSLSVFNSFLKTGVRKEYNKELTQFVILNNFFALQCLVIFGAAILTTTLFSIAFPYWVILIMTFISGLTFYFNSLKQHILATYFLNCSINIALFCVCLFYGKQNGAYFYYLPIVSGVGLVFTSNVSKRHLYFQTFITIFCAIVFFAIGDKLHTPVHFTDRENSILLAHNFIVTLIISLMSGFFSARGNQMRYRLQEKVIVQKQINEKNSVSALKENKVLLAEIHHRVKNNLAIMRSLIRLQISNINDEKLEPYFNDLLNRIDSMSFVHEKLYRNNNFSFIQSKDFLKQIAQNIINSFDYRHDIQFNFKSDNCVLNLNDAIPLALITNEAITNSMKYAFSKPALSKVISFELIQNKDKSLNVVISDNGIGFNLGDLEREQNSIGNFLIRSLSEQLDGTVEFYNDNGAVVNCHLFTSHHHSRTDTSSQALVSTSFEA
jgi:two-component sensor histidine kinase